MKQLPDAAYISSFHDDVAVTALLKRLKDFPSLSGIILKVERLIENPNTSAHDLEELIKLDPALTARILRVANSGYYAFRQRISDLSHAIAILGFNTIKTIVLTSEVFSVFPAKRNRLFDRYEFWKHSVATACGAVALARAFNLDSVDDVFVAAMLHDIGKLALDEIMPSEFRVVMEHVEKTRTDMCSVEQSHFGIHHCDVAAYLAEKWKFPDSLIVLMKNCRIPGKAGALYNQALCIQFADILARLYCFGMDGEYGSPLIDEGIFELVDDCSISSTELYQQLFYEMDTASTFLDSFI